MVIKTKSRRIELISRNYSIRRPGRKDGGRREKIVERIYYVGWCVGGHTWMDRVQSNTLVNMWAVTRKLSTREPCPG